MIRVGRARDDFDALETAVLISFVYSLAPATAEDRDIHFSESLCKSVRDTFLGLNKDSHKLTSKPVE